MLFSMSVTQRKSTRRPATYADLRKVPENQVAEILGGQLYTTPRPAPPHADAASGLGGALRGPFDRARGGPGGWRILFEPELHLGPDVVVPDLAGWLRERLPVLPNEAYFALAPDWTTKAVMIQPALAISSPNYVRNNPDSPTSGSYYHLPRSAEGLPARALLFIVLRVLCTCRQDKTMP